MKYADVYNATITYAKREAKEEGFGLCRRETAKSMLKDGLKPTFIARHTKLSRKEILALR